MAAFKELEQKFKIYMETQKTPNKHSVIFLRKFLKFVGNFFFKLYFAKAKTTRNCGYDW